MTEFVDTVVPRTAAARTLQDGLHAGHDAREARPWCAPQPAPRGAASRRGCGERSGSSRTGRCLRRAPARVHLPARRGHPSDSPLRGLERYEGAPVEAIRGATRRAFENLVTLALDEAVAFVVLVGDLYDGDWKDYNTGLFFSHQMARLHAAGIRAYLVAGNHDAASQLTRALRPPPNVHVFATAAPQTFTLPEFGVALHGQGYATREVTADLSQAYPRALPGLCNLGLLHTSLDGRPGHAPYAPCSVAGLATRGYQYWALGHVHQHEIVAREPVVFPETSRPPRARDRCQGCGAGPRGGHGHRDGRTPRTRRRRWSMATSTSAPALPRRRLRSGATGPGGVRRRAAGRRRGAFAPGRRESPPRTSAPVARAGEPMPRSP